MDPAVFCTQQFSNLDGCWSDLHVSSHSHLTQSPPVQIQITPVAIQIQARCYEWTLASSALLQGEQTWPAFTFSGCSTLNDCWSNLHLHRCRMGQWSDDPDDCWPNLCLLLRRLHQQSGESVIWPLAQSVPAETDRDTARSKCQPDNTAGLFSPTVAAQI